ncbi:MAG: hypothetical protein GY888_27715, partial [Planctomycetaceae bacterium]|nr:hypothetical protein [Planctomycetaceae bacterium]
MELPSTATLEVEAGVATVHHEDNTLLVAVPGFQQAAQFSLKDNRLVLTFKKGNDPLKGSVWFTDSRVDPDAMADINAQLADLETDLDVYTHGGPAQYTTAIDVPAKKWFESEAWLV